MKGYSTANMRLLLTAFQIQSQEHVPKHLEEKLLQAA